MYACVVDAVWLSGLGCCTCMMCDVGYTCMWDPEVMGTASDACMYTSLRTYVITQCAYPVTVCMVNVGCAHWCLS